MALPVFADLIDQAALDAVAAYVEIVAIATGLALGLVIYLLGLIGMAMLAGRGMR